MQQQEVKEKPLFDPKEVDRFVRAMNFWMIKDDVSRSTKKKRVLRGPQGLPPRENA